MKPSERRAYERTRFVVGWVLGCAAWAVFFFVAFCLFILWTMPAVIK